MKIQGLYAIVDNGLIPHRTHQQLARGLLTGGARILQLRIKSDRYSRLEIFKIGREILSLKKETPFCFIVNDDLEMARELNADGYHGGKDDCSIEEARELLGPDRLIGYSAHSLEEAVEAERRGANYVAFGTIFSSPSKGPGHPVQGVERLREVVSRLRVPVVAIGGIGRKNIHDVLAAGAASVAMISALVSANDVVRETEFFARLFQRSLGVSR